MDRAQEHSAGHIAALVKNLPQDSAVHRFYDHDSVWTLENILLASIANSLNLFIWGMGDKNKRGKRPDLIGPDRMRNKTRKLDAQVMTIDELMERLNIEKR